MHTTINGDQWRLYEHVKVEKYKEAHDLQVDAAFLYRLFDRFGAAGLKVGAKLMARDCGQARPPLPVMDGVVVDEIAHVAHVRLKPAHALVVEGLLRDVGTDHYGGRGHCFGLHEVHAVEQCDGLAGGRSKRSGHSDAEAHVGHKGRAGRSSRTSQGEWCRRI